MNTVMVWLVVLILCLIIEASTMGLTTIWFAGGSLIALFLALAGIEMKIQIIVFLVISFVLLFSTRPLAVRYFNREREKTNLDSLIGRKAAVLEKINSLEDKGLVNVNGVEWRASAEEVIREGEIVVIREIKGVKLIVERERKEEGRRRKEKEK